MLASTPVLLCMQTSLLATKRARLQQLASSYSEWLKSFNAATPATLAVQLTYSMDRYARLEFIAEQRRKLHEQQQQQRQGLRRARQQQQTGPGLSASAEAGDLPGACSSSSSGGVGDDGGGSGEGSSGAGLGQRLRRGVTNDWLADSRAADKNYGFTSILGLTASAFNARFPGFEAWAKRRGAKAASEGGDE